MYLDYLGWWPTWLSSPYLQRTHFSTLYVQIRILDPPKEDVPKSWGSDYFFWRTDLNATSRGISPAGVTTAFHQIFLAFLRHGPRFRPKLVEDVEGRYSAQNVILDVLPPENPEDHIILGYMHGVHSQWDFFLQHRFVGLGAWPRQWPKPEEMKPEYLPAEKLACFIWTWLRMVLIFKDPLYESHTFYGGVGALEVRVDGEQRKAADLSHWLERLHREKWPSISMRGIERTKIRDTLCELRKARSLGDGSVAHSSGDEGDDNLADVEDDYADYHRWSSQHDLDTWSNDDWDNDILVDYYESLGFRLTRPS